MTLLEAKVPNLVPLKNVNFWNPLIDIYVETTF